MTMTRILVLLVSLWICGVDSFAPIGSKATQESISKSHASSSSIPYFAEEAAPEFAKKNKNEQSVVVAGATGYIGRAVVEESVRRGYNTIALVRNATRLQTEESRLLYGTSYDGAKIMQCNVEDPQELQALMASLETPVDTVVSCLASATGTKKEAYAIDYQATLNCLQAGQSVNARHFVLLSAFCCRNPLLQLQQAKLKFEAELAKQDQMTWSVVRPTAFFKSVSGQLEAIRQGAPYVLFGDGAVTRCNPIAESELAQFMMDCLIDNEKCNKIMNVGGPDEPLTNQRLGEMMYKAIGREPKFVYAPTWIFDYIINFLQYLADTFQTEGLQDAAETGRIGKYYAVEDMLTTDPSEKFGTITMQDHYDKIAAEGQDPFTPIRATAVIGRVLEAIPAMTLALPAVWAASDPKAVQVVMAEPRLDFSMMLASITSGFHAL